VVADIEDADDDDPVQPCPGTQDAFHLDAAMGHAVGQFVDRHVGGRELP
jgi:hypothetical protein